MDNVCGNRLYVGIPDWGCICVPQVFRLRSNRGMDCHDDRLGIPWALLLPALLWEQMGKSLAIVIWEVKGLSDNIAWHDRTKKCWARGFDTVEMRFKMEGSHYRIWLSF